MNRTDGLLTKAFQHECHLVDELKKPFCQLQFPCVSNISEFQELKDNCEKFLSQYDIKIGAISILYPKEASKVFVLPINKLPVDQFLEKLEALSKDIKLYEALHPYGVVQVKELLGNGANINSKSIVGDTLLHIAVQKGYDAIVSLLLEEGASINIPNIQGETALQIADQKKDGLMGKRLIEALLNKDSKTEKPDFSMQELHQYWDEQIKKLADKSPVQAVPEEGAAGGAEVTPRDPKARTTIAFFSSTTRLSDEQQAKKKQRLQI